MIMFKKNWKDYKTQWYWFEQSGGLEKMSKAQKMALFLYQAGIEAQRHIGDIDPEKTLETIEDVQKVLDKYFLSRKNVRYNFNSSQ